MKLSRIDEIVGNLWQDWFADGRIRRIPTECSIDWLFRLDVTTDPSRLTQVRSFVMSSIRDWYLGWGRLQIALLLSPHSSIELFESNGQRFGAIRSGFSSIVTYACHSYRMCHVIGHAGHVTCDWTVMQSTNRWIPLRLAGWAERVPSQRLILKARLIQWVHWLLNWWWWLELVAGCPLGSPGSTFHPSTLTRLSQEARTKSWAMRFFPGLMTGTEERWIRILEG